MIRTSSRPLTASELEQRKLAVKVGKWGVSRSFVLLFPIVGTFLTAMPFIGGGWMLATVLKVRPLVPTLVGGLLGISFGMWRVRRESKELAISEAALEAGQRRYDADLEQGEMQIVEIDEVCESWDVSNLEDFGPGYILRTKSDEYIYLCGQVLEDEHEVSDAVHQDEVFPKEHIELEMWPVSRELVCMTSRGAVVNSSGSVDFTALGLDLLIGFHVFEKQIAFETMLKSY